MNIEQIRNYCFSKPKAEECFPFDNDTLVFKLGGKIFALIDIEKFNSINLKCDPERAIQLRETYYGVSPGFHMNKKHWNTILFNSDVPNNIIFECIDESYDLILNSLTKKQKVDLEL